MREDAGKSRFCKPWKVYENTGGRYGKKKMLTLDVHTTTHLDVST